MENILVADYLPPEEHIHKTSRKVRLDYARVHVFLIDDFDHVFIYIPTNYVTDPKFAHVHTRWKHLANYKLVAPSRMKHGETMWNTICW